jgi:hypothetical protein
MIDCTGMCGSCLVEVEDRVLFACVESPEFDGHKVDFDQLMQRLQAYSEEERQSLMPTGWQRTTGASSEKSRALIWRRSKRMR